MECTLLFNIADGTMMDDLVKKEDDGWSEDGDGCPLVAQSLSVDRPYGRLMPSLLPQW